MHVVLNAALEPISLVGGLMAAVIASHFRSRANHQE